MYCTACNLEYAEELKYCRNCGQVLVRALGEAVTESLCCTRCGARLLRGEKGCQLCGAKTGALGQETVTGSCHNCGTYWRSSWLFCKRCGLDRDRALQLNVAPASKATAAKAALLREILSDAANLQCAYCGAETPPNSHFCENCGMRLTRPANGSSVAPTVPAIDPLAQTVEEEPLISLKDLKGATVANLEQPSRRIQTSAAPVPPVEPQIEHRTNPPGDVEAERVVEKKRVTTAFPPPPGSRAGAGQKKMGQVRGQDQSTNKIAPTAQNLGTDTSPNFPTVETQRIGRRSRWATWMVIFAIALLSFLITAVWQSVWRQRRSTLVVQTEPSLAPSASPQNSPQAVTETTAQVPAGMVFIPGGVFEMGRETGDEYERPQHFVEVKPFYLDRTEVTNEQYKAFVDATGHPAPVYWRGNQPPDGEANYPVINVSWPDAKAYAEWAGKRLPTEEEWEFAARGSDGRLYPWGMDWNKDFANTAESGGNQIVEAGRYPGGASPFGVLDLCGNVWEWTASDLRSYLTQKVLVADRKVIRGGAYDVRNDRATTTYRGAVQADKGYPKTGFRCARDIQ
jgi:formylglycine-generating enzyme required for sulfatase activity